MFSTLLDFIAAHERIFVLTGAGVSTASGIPDYRDESGNWKQQKPMEYREFVDRHEARQRYWSRSFIGWQRFQRAQPNPAHRALARLEQLGRLARTVTQNVDGLHQRAGSRRLTELHGTLSSVACLDCGSVIPRETMQRRLLDANPGLALLSAPGAPDGDALLRDFDDGEVRVPDCRSCGGILKPEVVFFGETVPAIRVQECYAALQRADAMLIVGSSLMVYSGFRFVREAARLDLPIAAINRGKTRADELLSLKHETDCAAALVAVLDRFDTNLANHG
ncbi:MAG: NAD-dependent protein deacetylase [Gammaproteobacteria bacterium]|nr:NAD-dependent protein deacetylase [Gammaproteobacteria bacterium]MDH3536191.1 NAD-dependent protein deacetylase [Gammaproteobacteria bacterium]